MIEMRAVELLVKWISARVDVAVGEKTAAGEQIEQLANFTCKYPLRVRVRFVARVLLVGASWGQFTITKHICKIINLRKVFFF